MKRILDFDFDQYFYVVIQIVEKNCEISDRTAEESNPKITFAATIFHEHQ